MAAEYRHSNPAFPEQRARAELKRLIDQANHNHGEDVTNAIGIPCLTQHQNQARLSHIETEKLLKSF
jgi:hypothetical protein